jgi:hypothetical protein
MKKKPIVAKDVVGLTEGDSKNDKEFDLIIISQKRGPLYHHPCDCPGHRP